MNEIKLENNNKHKYNRKKKREIKRVAEWLYLELKWAINLFFFLFIHRTYAFAKNSLCNCCYLVWQNTVFNKIIKNVCIWP